MGLCRAYYFSCLRDVGKKSKEKADRMGYLSEKNSEYCNPLGENASSIFDM